MAALVATMLVLVGCTPVSKVVEGTSVTVAVDQPMTSYNPNTGFGSATPSNASIFAATNSSFVSYDETPSLQKDTSFGLATVVSTEPLVVTYAVADGIRWSDGTPVDAADLLLAWAANSTNLNDPEFDPTEFIDQGTGRFTDDFPRDVVYFDGFTGNGLQLVTQTPEMGADGRSITMTFDEYFADWSLVFDLGMPAHVVAGKALRIAEPLAAKDALIDAIEADNRRKLGAIARFWNSGFNLTDDVPGEQLTLTVNPEYRGDNLPYFEEVVVRFISDPLQAVAAMDAGEVDIIAPQVTEDVISALESADGAHVDHGFSGTWERLDLKFSASKNGAIENQLVRQAFLNTVPRQEILDSIIRPVGPEATLRDSQVFLPGAPGYDDAVEENGSRSYARVNISRAERLLAQAAETDPSLAAPTVCLLFDPANPKRVAEFQLIKSSAAQADITVTNCSSPDWNNLLGTPNSYDAALYALRETNLAVSAVEAAFSSTSGLNNHGAYSSPAADALLADARGPVSAKERRALLTELDALLWEDAVGLPLYQFPTVTATSDKVTGVIRSPFAPTALWNPWRWKPVVED